MDAVYSSPMVFDSRAVLKSMVLVCTLVTPVYPVFRGCGSIKVGFLRGCNKISYQTFQAIVSPFLQTATFPKTFPHRCSFLLSYIYLSFRLPPSINVCSRVRFALMKRFYHYHQSLCFSKHVYQTHTEVSILHLGLYLYI